jgi:hypothetical protein
MGVETESLLACFEHWVKTIREQEEREQIAFDGKVVRGSGNSLFLNALQLMSAMVVDTGLIHYQQEVSDKTNEIPVMQVKDNQRHLHKEIAAFFYKTYRHSPQPLDKWLL